MELDHSSIRNHCLAKEAVSAGYPFGEGSLVFKALDKMFALIAEDMAPLRLTLKCDPEDAQALRAQYPAVIPGYYMNKRHWNTIILDGSLPPALVYELIDHSYQLVVKKMKKSDREKLLGMT